MRNRFSIIIPLYNVEHGYLFSALDSVRKQSVGDWECICVDDGSTNHPEAVINEFSEGDSRFQMFRQDNRGVGSARNFALQKAHGDWVVFLDGDDMLCLNALEILSSAIDRIPDARIVRYDVERFEEHADWLPEIADETNVKCYDVSGMFPMELLSGTCALQFAFRRDLVEEVRFPSLVVNEDRLFLFECFKLVDRVPYVLLPLYGYRQRKGSAVHQPVSCRTLNDSLEFAERALSLAGDDRRFGSLYQESSLVRFLSHDFVVYAVQCVPRAEDAMNLWERWFDAVGNLVGRGRVGLALGCVLMPCIWSRSRVVSYLLAGVFLAFAWRVRLPFAKVFDPDFHKV